MKNLFLFLFSFIIIQAGFSQTVKQLNGPDCNGNNHDLLADLDSGKAVIMFFFMPNCSSCPPPAQKVQKMANNLLATYPNSITGYAMPYNNSTTCSATNSWISTSNVPFYFPYDSGADLVANYGGFGMPTVVVLGGKGANRRVLFSTLNFVTSDTATMRDSIKSIIVPKTTSSLNKSSDINQVFQFKIDVSKSSIEIDWKKESVQEAKVELIDLMGKVVTVQTIHHDAADKSIPVRQLPAGNYILRFTSDRLVESKQINIMK